MGSFGLIVIIAVFIVALFVVGMSLTLIFKGHHIKSEIGENPEMRRRGIKCAVEEIRQEEARLRGLDSCELPIGCSTADCSSCDPESEGKKPQ